MLGAEEPVVVTTFAADMGSPENQTLFRSSILRSIAAAEARIAAAEARMAEGEDTLEALFHRSIRRGVGVEQLVAAEELDWEDEFDEMDSEFGVPCPHSNNLALCEVCD
jgi:hypothetical protein